jgi:hypothetical protein
VNYTGGNPQFRDWLATVPTSERRTHRRLETQRPVTSPQTLHASGPMERVVVLAIAKTTAETVELTHVQTP